MRVITRRKILCGLAGLSLLYPLVACGKGNVFMRKEITLNVVLYSYLNRPIFDVLLNDGDIGVANAYGGGGVMTGVTIPFGPQTLSWRLDGPKGTPRNGETVAVKNSLILTKDQTPPQAEYLGVHIYPDSTAELFLSQYIPEISPRGQKILDEVRKISLSEALEQFP
jgi:hypothetical protein